MLMLARLERILVKLAQQHAPQLTPPGWEQRGEQTTRIQTLARKLAKYNVCVLVGDVPKDIMPMRDMHIQDWVRNYGQMYNLLSQALYPSLARITAHYADDRLPAVIVLNGDANPIMNVFSGTLNPYLAIRQPLQHQVTDLELRGLITYLLDELEARDLKHADYEALRENSVVLLKQMLRATVRHISLTSFDRPILDTIQPPPPPPTIPANDDSQQTQTIPKAPDLVPDQSRKQIRHDLETLPDDDAPVTPTEQMFISKIPIPRATGKWRRPPVRKLPDDRD